MPAPQPTSPIDAAFVDTDIQALASHMDHCAFAHGRWSGLRGGLQWLGTMAAGHIVTTACLFLLFALAFVEIS